MSDTEALPAELRAKLVCVAHASLDLLEFCVGALQVPSNAEAIDLVVRLRHALIERSPPGNPPQPEP